MTNFVKLSIDACDSLSSNFANHLAFYLLESCDAHTFNSSCQCRVVGLWFGQQSTFVSIFLRCLLMTEMVFTLASMKLSLSSVLNNLLSFRSESCCRSCLLIVWCLHLGHKHSKLDICLWILYLGLKELSPTS